MGVLCCVVLYFVVVILYSTLLYSTLLYSTLLSSLLSTCSPYSAMQEGYTLYIHICNLPTQRRAPFCAMYIYIGYIIYHNNQSIFRASMYCIMYVGKWRASNKVKVKVKVKAKRGETIRDEMKRNETRLGMSMRQVVGRRYVHIFHLVKYM